MPRNAERGLSFAELLAALRLAGIAAWRLARGRLPWLAAAAQHNTRTQHAAPRTAPQAAVPTAAPSGTAGPESPRLEINPY